MQEIQPYSAPPESGAAPDITVKDIGKIVQRRKKIILSILLPCLALGAVMALMPHKWYAENELMLIQHPPSTSATTATSLGYTTEETIDTPFAMIQTNAMYQHVLDWMLHDAKVQAKAQGKPVDKVTYASLPYTLLTLPKHLKFTNPKDTNVIEIMADGKTKKNAMWLARSAGNSFVAWKTQLAQEDLTQAIPSLRARTDQSRRNLYAAQRAETAFKQKYRFADEPSQEQSLLAQLASLKTQVSDAQQDLGSQQARLNTLSAQLQRANVAIATGSGVRDDQSVQALQAQLTQAEIAYEKSRQQYTSAYPGVLGDQEGQIRDLKQRLARAVQGTINNTTPDLPSQLALQEQYRQQQVQVRFSQAKLGTAQSQLALAQQTSQTFPEIDQQYVRLHQATTDASTLFSGLQSALTQALINRDTIKGDVQVTHAAILDPFDLPTTLIEYIAVGGLLGGFLALFAVLLVEQADKKLYRVEDVRRLVSGTIIGALPEMTGKDKRALARGSVPPQIAEPFNFARANLALVVRQATQRDLWQHQVILVTSAAPGEGKSFTAANLARSLAQSGKKVILVDANLHRPAQYDLFRSGAQHGVADVLTGGMPLAEAIAPTNTDNLNLLYSGHAVQNPTDLLAMPQAAQMIDALRREAEVVIIDTPACSVAADALYLAPYADCVLQVIGVGMVDEATLADANAALYAAAPKSLASFLNHTPRERRRKEAYSYARQYSRSGAVARPALPQNGTVKDSAALLEEKNFAFAARSHQNGAASEGTAHDLSVVKPAVPVQDEESI